MSTLVSKPSEGPVEAPGVQGAGEGGDGARHTVGGEKVLRQPPQLCINGSCDVLLGLRICSFLQTGDVARGTLRDHDCRRTRLCLLAETTAYAAGFVPQIRRIERKSG